MLTEAKADAAAWAPAPPLCTASQGGGVRLEPRSIALTGLPRRGSESSPPQPVRQRWLQPWRRHLPAAQQHGPLGFSAGGGSEISRLAVRAAAAAAAAAAAGAPERSPARRRWQQRYPGLVRGGGGGRRGRWGGAMGGFELDHLERLAGGLGSAAIATGERKPCSWQQGKAGPHRRPAPERQPGQTPGRCLQDSHRDRQQSE